MTGICVHIIKMSENISHHDQKTYKYVNDCFKVQQFSRNNQSLL